MRNIRPERLMPRPANQSTLSPSPRSSSGSSEASATTSASRRRDDGDRALRNALGQFATGVTVITTRTADGVPIGVTINSFNAVSLDPPLILWSLSLATAKLAHFRRAAHYAVNVLSANQAPVSESFAAADENPFAGLQIRDGPGGIPLLENCVACFECTPEAEYPGGDHLIFVGRVTRFFSAESREPLIFHAGRYRSLA